MKSSNTNSKIVLIGSGGTTVNIIYHALSKKFFIDCVILENPESFVTVLKRRVKRLGIFTVFGQVLFRLFVVGMLQVRSKKRIKRILEKFNLNIAPIPEKKIVRVPSVNDETTIRLLRDMKPDLVIVHVTRIIAKKVLGAVSCKFVNIHAGVTPKYRGVHGMYWALVNDDRQNSGVTVHFVDAGIDTGGIIGQARVLPEPSDNFVTYPLLQLAEGLEILKRSVPDILDGSVQLKKGTNESRLWYHPTVFRYWYYRIKKKVK